LPKRSNDKLTYSKGNSIPDGMTSRMITGLNKAG